MLSQVKRPGARAECCFGHHQTGYISGAADFGWAAVLWEKGMLLEDLRPKAD